MTKKHGVGRKNRIFHPGYDLLPVWLRLGSDITKIGV